MHWGWQAPLRRCIYIYFYIYIHTYTYTMLVGQLPEQELTILAFPWKMLLQRKALRISHPSGSITKNRKPARRKDGEEPPGEGGGGTKGTPAPPQQRPRAVSYLCTRGRAHNNELCHRPFSLRGISSPLLWDLSGEII